MSLRSWLAPVLSLMAAAAGCNRAALVRTVAGPIRFRDTSAEMGLVFQAGIRDKTPLNIAEVMGGGAAFIDLNDDGWPDIVLTGYSGCALYLNEHGRRFVDATAGSGLARVPGDWQGIACADYDGDGKRDLLLTGHGRLALMRGLGSGRFTEVTDQAGVRLPSWSTSAAFADVDGDGWLDLLVGCYVDFHQGMPEFFVKPGARLTFGPDAYPAQHSVLFRNLGNGRFANVTQAAGLTVAHGKTLGVAFADYDDDGDPDLYLANDRVPGDFFRNDGRGHFTSVGVENGTALSAAGKRQAGMGVAWGDYDGDGRLDLAVTTFEAEPKGLYRQEEDLMFREVGTETGLAIPTLPWVAFGIQFADWDNDGHLDLMVANGHVQDQQDRVDAALGYAQPTILLRNSGNGTFTDRMAGAAFSRRIVGRALAAADYDRDGRPDALIANLAGPPLLLHNESDAGRWIAFRLRGRAPNRDGIGARLTLRANERTQVREVHSDGSYMSASDPTAYFGLGKVSGPIELDVRWPDGTMQQVRGLGAGAVVEIRQGVSVR